MRRVIVAFGLLASTVPAHASWRLSPGNPVAVGRCRSPVEVVQLAWTDTQESRSPEELEAEQRRVEQHLLRVQQERFEARARGESEKKIQRLDREFKHTQQRRIDVINDLKAAE